MTKIRAARKGDRDGIWKIFQAVVATGDTYVFDPQISRTEALRYWLRSDTHTYVASRSGKIVGTYILRPNQPGLGSHVANAAFMVSPSVRGLGIGRAMGDHCQAEARKLKFRAIQFNLVVSTNQAAVRLWKQLGFTIIATVPEAFRHSQLGFVDAYIMFRFIDT